MKQVFLGGTCNGSTWRSTLVQKLTIDYYDPVVPVWTPECMAEEIKQRADCDYCLYVLTPKMTGVYSIAEVVDDSNKRPNKTIFVALREDGDDTFTVFQWKSLMQVSRMVSENGGAVFTSLEEVADFLNLQQ